MPRPALLIGLVGTALWAQVSQTSKEAALGTYLAQQVRQGTTEFDSPEVKAYVQQLGQRLVSGDSFTFSVVTDERGGRTFDPTSLPGGYVFVSTSLLTAAQNEAEFAGMLAHAMAHVSNRRIAPTANGAPLVFLGGWNTADSDLAVPNAFRERQRAIEQEADATAIRVLSDAGFDPRALAQYIERRQPSDSERIAAIHQHLAALPEREYPATDGNFQRIQSLIRPPTVRRVAPSLFPR